jgi:outer membrane protein insertion porin family
MNMNNAMRKLASESVATVSSMALMIGAGLVAPVASAQSAVQPAAQQSAPAQPGAVIANIRVEGNLRVEAATVRSYLLVQPGDPFDPARIDLSVKTLFATGRFSDVSVERSGNDLLIRVAENPVINQVLFEGNRAIDEEDMIDEIEAAPREVFTTARVQTDVQRILELYRRSGRFAASVEPTFKPLPQNRVDLIFEISEGPVSGVRGINFLGNRAFSDRALREEVATEQSRWWKLLTSNDNYDPDRLEYDRDQLRKFYTNRGYADFRVVSAVAELSPDQKDFFITFTIDEGQLYNFGAIKVDTALEKLNSDRLALFVGIKEGDLYEGDRIEKAVESLTFAAGAAGYAFADVRPVLERNETNGTIDITFAVDEGPRVYIDRFDIVNNTRTLDSVIRREMLIAEGDPFNRVLLDQSRNRIRALGFFEEVEYTEIADPDRPDRTRVVISVKEQPTGELSFAAGLSSTDGFLIDLSASERNLRGRGQFLRFRVQSSERQRQVDIRFTEPKFLGLNLAAGVDIFSTRSDFLDIADFLTETNGLGFRVGFPTSSRSSLLLNYTIRQDDIQVDRRVIQTDTAGNPILDGNGNFIFIRECDQPNPPSLCRQDGNRITSVLGYTLNWDRRNDPIQPTRGFLLSGTQALAGLGGDVKYLRTEGTAEVYYGLPWEAFIASAKFSGGYVAGLEGDDILINDRFFKGGNSFRGFDVAGVGPREFLATRDADGNVSFTYGDAYGARAYAITTLELTVPTGLPEQYGIKAALFSDFGWVGLLDDIDKQTVTTDSSVFGVDDALTLRASAGVSIFWRSPFGPIRFDFAQVLASEEYDRTESFRFSTSTRF